MRLPRAAGERRQRQTSGSARDIIPSVNTAPPATSDYLRVRTTDPTTRLPERRLVVQLILGVVLYVLCQLALPLGAIAGFLVSGDTRTGADVGTLLGEGGAPTIFAFGLSALIALGGFVLILRFVSKRSPAEVLGPQVGREIGWGLLIGFGIVALGVAVLAAVGVYRVADVSFTAGIITGLMFGIGPAVAEEVFFRGFLLRIFDNWWGSWVALVVVSIVFAIFHSISSEAGAVAGVFVLFTASLMLNLAYFLTRRLWLPIALHAAFNAAQSAIFGLNVSGSETSGSWLNGVLQGPELLTGGVMGGEGSVAIVGVAFAAGVVMLLAALRRGVMLPPRARSGARVA